MSKPLPPSVTKSLALAAVLLPSLAYGQASHLVISQVYGGGGGTTATTTYTYNTDYIELYNPTSAAIDLTGLSLQYGSAAGNFGASASNIKVLSGTVAAHGYYLVSGNSGTVGGTLPTADATSSLSLSATAGKVALVNGTSSISSLGAATCTGTQFVDEVSYGTGTSCAETTAAGAPGNTTAVYRDAAGDDTDNNKNDFTVGTPNPHNSSSTSAPITAIAISSATANPASISAGSSTTLSVTVTPGSASTSVTVTADLSTVGGSSTQALTLGSTANTYIYTLATSGSLAAGSYSLPVKATDQTNASASSTVALTVTAAVTSTPISTIQANRAKYVGGTITTTGVVTLVTASGYYMQTASSTPGSTGDEGIYVYSGSGKNPAGAVVGNNVTITGSLTLYPASTASHTPSLEVTGASLTVNGTATVPAPISIKSVTAGGGIYQLTPYESMRVSFPSLTATGPTTGNLTETTETTTSTGQFYTVITGTARPFREPGMDFRDYPASTCPTVSNCTATATAAGVQRPSNVTLFDDNPERIIVESSLGGGTALDVSTGAVLTAPTGVIDFTYSTDVPYGDPARLLLEPGQFTSTSSNFAQGMSITPVSATSAGTFTVAAFNAERFFNPSSTDNKYYNAGTGTVGTSSAVNVTTDAYQRRLQKISLAIRTVLNYPDILSMEEVENIAVLKDISAQIDADTTTGTAPHYVAYGTDSSTTYTNDVGGISVGFLVKSTLGVTDWTQIGNTSTFTTAAGNVSTLNDRPSQVLHATVPRGTGVTPYPITIISNHLRSLSGIGTSADTRTKKELQAEMLASAIETYQSKGEHVIAVGDFNAFQFSDGYTDTLGTITGNVGTNVAAQPGKSGILSKTAVDLITTLPAAQQQTYVEFGNAQVLDHVVVTQDLANSGLQVAHFDSDFPEVLGNSATTAARVSDHDVPVTYITLPTPSTNATLTGNGQFSPANVGTSAPGQQFVLTNNGETAITISSIVTTGDFAQSNNCGTSLSVGGTCAINVTFTPTAAGTRSGTLTVNSSATVAPVTLTGTGVANTASLSGTTTVTATSTGYNVTVTLTNGGNGAASNVTLTGVTLGSANGTPTPQSLGTVAAGASASATVAVPASAGTPGSTVATKFTATYTGGSLSGSARTKLPTVN